MKWLAKFFVRTAIRFALFSFIGSLISFGLWGQNTNHIFKSAAAALSSVSQQISTFSVSTAPAQTSPNAKPLTPYKPSPLEIETEKNLKELMSHHSLNNLKKTAALLTKELNNSDVLGQGVNKVDRDLITESSPH
jgi:hypothetical protein